jgi:hypothetical protein
MIYNQIKFKRGNPWFFRNPADFQTPHPLPLIRRDLKEGV